MGKLKNMGDFSNASPAPLVSSDDVVLANRYEERIRKQEMQRAVVISPYEREKVSKLFAQLVSSIGSYPPDPWRVSKFSAARGTDARQAPAYREAAEAHLAAIQEQYLAEPLTVSEELSRSHPVPEYVGEEL